VTFGVSLTLVLFPAAGAAVVQPDPGNALARAAGLALLAEPPGALAVFDQPARLAPAGPARFSLAAARTRPFGFDALARTRLAAAYARGAAAIALGFEAYGPEGARRTRLVVGGAWRRRRGEGELRVGAAWQEARIDGIAPAASARAGALDAGGSYARGALAVALAARALAGGGSPRVRPDPDWTLEARLDVGPARLHGALTHDLVGTRPGGGVAFAVGPCVLQAGAFGPPWSGALGVALASRTSRGARVAASRGDHPELGPSDAWDAGVTW
jgi:hypothetical protein